MLPKIIVTKAIELQDQDGETIVLPGETYHPVKLITVGEQPCYICKEEYKPGVPQLIMGFLVERIEF